MSPGDVVADVDGSVAGILKAERVSLNFLQRLSGIATATAAYVKAVQGTKARIIDTRKTVPRPATAGEVRRARGRRPQPPL